MLRAEDPKGGHTVTAIATKPALAEVHRRSVLFDNSRGLKFVVPMLGPFLTEAVLARSDSRAVKVSAGHAPVELFPDPQHCDIEVSCAMLQQTTSFGEAHYPNIGDSGKLRPSRLRTGNPAALRERLKIPAG